MRRIEVRSNYHTGEKMAKPKVKFLVNVLPSKTIEIWVSEPEIAFLKIRVIEGVSQVNLYPDRAMHAFADPRYDIEEVAEEIRTLLSSEAPDIFREE